MNRTSPTPSSAAPRERAVHYLGAMLGLDRAELDAVLAAAGFDTAPEGVHAALERYYCRYFEQDRARLVAGIREPPALEAIRERLCGGPAPLGGVFEVRLRSGRRVGVTDLAFTETYSGLFLGRPDRLVQRFRNNWVVRVRERWSNQEVLVREPELVRMSSDPAAGRLPRTACAALLDSAPIDPEFMASSLILVWWQERLVGTLPGMIQAQIRDLDWENTARDYDL